MIKSSANMHFTSKSVFASTLLLVSALFAQEPIPTASEANDSINLFAAAEAEKEPKAKIFLKQLAWQPAAFSVKWLPITPTSQDRVLYFPSPKPMGDALVDKVSAEWFVARDAAGAAKKAPALIVVHESNRAMLVGRVIAMGLRSKGFHTFLIHLPGFGRRKSEQAGDQIGNLFSAMQQGMADIRRCRDALASLPEVDAKQISLQGTSMGGFLVAGVAGMDAAFHRHFVLLAGGNLSLTLLTGQQDAGNMRRQLFARGLSEEQIRQSADKVDPLLLAHRVPSEQTWLFYGTRDTVVPPRCSEEWAAAAKLPTNHALAYPVGHYDAAAKMPAILEQMTNLLRGRPINEGLSAALKLPGGTAEPK